MLPVRLRVALRPERQAALPKTSDQPELHGDHRLRVIGLDPTDKRGPERTQFTALSSKPPDPWILAAQEVCEQLRNVRNFPGLQGHGARSYHLPGVGSSLPSPRAPRPGCYLDHEPDEVA